MNKNKKLLMQLVTDKINNKTYLTYDEIAQITGYSAKYIIKFKREVLQGVDHSNHGNKNRKPIHTIPEDEKQKIINLYRKSSVSINRFCKFYHRRSYSCIYNILKEAGLIKKNNNM